jgi:putative ABC transport system ATP-binding protein
MAEDAGGGARLVAENIVVAYPLPHGGALRVLDIERLELPPGSQTAICGPSGSGKTTLLHLLCGGIERPSAGRVLWDGVDLFALGEAARDRWRRQSVGLVFQQFHLFPSLSPLENILLPARFRAFRVGKAAACRARALLDRVAIRATGETASLSRGEMQRVALARALLFAPPILLADEPTASLDAEAAVQVAELLFSASRERGATLLLVTHDAALAAQCPQIMYLAAGQLSGDPRIPLAAVS